MRVAILDPEPRVCGPTNWGFQIRDALRQMGHEAHVFSHTKSGRMRKSWGTPVLGGRWWSNAPDFCVKNDELTATLDSYDMAILPEIRVPSQDKEAIKEERLPHYVRALIETKTPWTSAVHGTMYPDRDMPFAKELLASPSRGKHLIALSWDSVKSNPILEALEWEYSYLPYAAKLPIDAPLPSGRTVGSTGRFIFNKGQPITCIAGAYLPSDVTVEVWGSCAVGQGPSPTYIVYETLRDHFGAQTKRYPTHIKEGGTPDGNIVSPYPWDARPAGGALVRYLGAYTDQLAVAQRMVVHVNLTSHQFSRGLVEFSTLEAADAGCLNIVPEHLSDKQFRMLPVTDYMPFSSPKKMYSDEGKKTAKYIADQIMKCLDIPEAQRREIVHHNRSILRTRNNPQVCAQQLIDSAFSR